MASFIADAKRIEDIPPLTGTKIYSFETSHLRRKLLFNLCSTRDEKCYLQKELFLVYIFDYSPHFIHFLRGRIGPEVLSLTILQDINTIKNILLDRITKYI